VESIFPMFPFWVVVGLALCAIVLIASVGVSIFMFVLKAGVIVQEAQKPAHMDSGDYRLDQGREVRGEGPVVAQAPDRTKQ
jgi:hypothetical protein